MTKRFVNGLFILAAIFAGSAGRASADPALLNQGWQILRQDNNRTVELRAQVVNESQGPLTYEVRFHVEVSDVSPTKRVASAGPPAAPAWSTLQTIIVPGEDLPAGDSLLVRGRFPYDLLVPGKLFRYRAELFDFSRAEVTREVIITSLENPFAALPVMAGAGLLGSAGRGLGVDPPGAEALRRSQPAPGSLSATAAAESAPALTSPGVTAASTASGSGQMNGRHTAQRVGGEWVEQGSGTMDVSGSQGRIVLNYTYNAHGPSAATLTATATATGWLYPPKGKAQRVQITSASAQMTAAGARSQTGSLVSRTGSTATGTFTGLVGTEAWSGLLTMTNGFQTLHLNNHDGKHSFDIRFTASR